MIALLRSNLGLHQSGSLKSTLPSMKLLSICLTVMTGLYLVLALHTQRVQGSQVISCADERSNFDNLALRTRLEENAERGSPSSDTSCPGNCTWDKTSGGLSQHDREFLSSIYSEARAVFEYGLGESTRIATATGVQVYAGVDSDANFVASERKRSPDHFHFYFADIGETAGWGVPTKKLRKQVMQYQLAPLMAELQAFDVYFVDGRYRIACVCVSLLHAHKHGKANALVLMHDYKTRKLYHEVELIADIVRSSTSSNLVALRRRANVSNNDIEHMWSRFKEEWK